MRLPSFRTLRSDLPAGLVVFLVALPLCLGIAFASGNVDGEQVVPPLAGVITGIIGGLLVGALSGSHTSVSGPAAGLIVMVLEVVRVYGYEGLLTVTVLAGGFQLIFAALRFGQISTLFPNAVVKGMLVAIGLILVLKQIPHGLGYDGDYEGDMAFAQADGRNTLTEIPFALGHMHYGAVIITLVALGLIIFRKHIPWVSKKTWLPGPLLAVVAGIGLNALFVAFVPSLALSGEYLVRLPTGTGFDAFSVLRTPDWGLLSSAAVWMAAFGIAVVASLETLLCADAVDELDPLKRKTPSNRELFAQGVGNAVAGLVGGIPITAVVVRGSANVQSGAKSRMSSIFHGALLLAAVMVGASVMNLIPLAALAAILLHIGWRLADPKGFLKMVRRAPDHWVPFVVTVGAILLTDLLKGITLGFILSTVFIAWRSLRLRGAVDQKVHIQLGPIVPPLNRIMLRRAVSRLEQDNTLVVDAADSDPICASTRETLTLLRQEAEARGASIEFQTELPTETAA